MLGKCIWKGMSILGLAMGLTALSARAQSSPPPSQEQQTPPDKPADPNQSGPPQQPPVTLPDNDIKTPLTLPPELEVRAIGSSTPMPSYSTLLRWGPVYVGEIELLQSYDQIGDYMASTNTGIFDQGSFNATILRATIVFDKQVRQNRLTLQYQPRLTVVNGRVSGDFLNQTIEFDWIQQLSPRWTLGVSNSFGYFSVRSMYGDYFLDVNAVTGTSVPTSFLDAGGSWLNTTARANFAYALSPTSSVSVAPFFGYGRTTDQTHGPVTTDIYQYGANVTWNKQLSASRNVRVDYYYRNIGDLGNTIPYQSLDFGITQQLGPSTVFGASGGVLSQGYLGGTQWSFSGSASASRKLGRSYVSVGYYRGLPLFSELNSQGIAQRVDANFRLSPSQRWYWSVDGGYEGSLATSVANVSGKYVSTEFGYNITPQVSVLASYAYKSQTSTDLNLLQGSRNYVLGGIRWTARAVQ